MIFLSDSSIRFLLARTPQAQFFLNWVFIDQNLIEDVKIPLQLALVDASRRLQQEISDLRTFDLHSWQENDLNPLPKPRGVVVPRRLGVAEGLEDLDDVGRWDSY